MVVRVKGFPNRFLPRPQSQDAKAITSLMCAARALNPLVSRVHARIPSIWPRSGQWASDSTIAQNSPPLLSFLPFFQHSKYILPMDIRLHHYAEPPPPPFFLHFFQHSEYIWPRGIRLHHRAERKPPPPPSPSFLSALNELPACLVIALALQWQHV